MTDNTEPLARATSTLEIRTVDLAAVNLTLARAYLDGSEPDTDPGALVTRGRHQVKRARQMVGTLGENPAQEVQLVRYQFGAELVVKDKEEVSADADNPDSSEEPWLSLSAEFRVEYLAKVMLDDEAIIAFGQRNVAYHVWPYWRELVQSSVARTRFPVPISVPHYFAKSGTEVERVQTAADEGSLESHSSEG